MNKYEYDSFETEKDSIIEELSAMKQSKSETQDQLGQVTRELGKLQREASQREADLESLEREKTTMQEEINNWKLDNSNHIQEILDLKEEIARLQTQMTVKENLSDEAGDARKEKEKILYEYTVIKEKYIMIETEKETLIHEKETLELDLSESRNTVER